MKRRELFIKAIGVATLTVGVKSVPSISISQPVPTVAGLSLGEEKVRATKAWLRDIIIKETGREPPTLDLAQIPKAPPGLQEYANHAAKCGQMAVEDKKKLGGL